MAMKYTLVNIEYERIERRDIVDKCARTSSHVGSASWSPSPEFDPAFRSSDWVDGSYRETCSHEGTSLSSVLA